MEEIWEAWQRRQSSQLHKLRVELTGHGVGPPKRYYRAAQRISLDISEWKAALQRPAGQGGMTATDDTSWHLYFDKYTAEQIAQEDQLIPYCKA